MPGKATSLPVRGAWIEIPAAGRRRESSYRRSPCGERGLKCSEQDVRDLAVESLPVRGAWIEMTLDKRRKKWYLSLPVRGAWIEIAR